MPTYRVILFNFTLPASAGYHNVTVRVSDGTDAVNFSWTVGSAPIVNTPPEADAGNSKEALQLRLMLLTGQLTAQNLSTVHD